jgi:GcrA cell cycle regulator
MGKGDAWTEEDNARIRELAAKGASTIRAAAALKRSRLAVRDQARKLGTPFPTVRDLRKRLAEADGPRN